MIEILLQAERSLTVGQLDAAERLYWQAIENDPKNSIAVVGLARVALERGDDRTAYQFARKALEIDGENAAAQRLVARLGEVMAHRGEVPPADGGQLPTRGGPAIAPSAGESAPATVAAAGRSATAAGGAAAAAGGPAAGGAATAAGGAATGSGRTTSPTPSAPPTSSVPPASRPPTRAVVSRPARKRGLLRRILGR